MAPRHDRGMPRVTITVDNRIRLDPSSIPSEVVDLLRQDFTHQNPQREMLRRIGKPFWGEPKEIATYALDGRELSLPRGGMGRLRKRLEEAGLRREVVDRRCRGDERAGARIPDHLIELWPFQRVALSVLVGRQCGIFRSGTGSGKTTVGIALASAVKLPTCVIVYNAGLFDQWVKRAGRELGIREQDVGVIKGPVRRLRPFTVAMQQTLNARGVDPEVARYFGVVIADEVQRTPSRTMACVMDQFPAVYRIGISASERRKDKKEFITYDLIGEIIHDVKRAELIKSGHVLDVQVRVVPTDFEAPWYGMPTDDNSDVEVDIVRLTEEMQEDFARNEVAIGCVLAEVRDRQVLVFSHRRDHCILLDRKLVALGIRTGFLIGGADYGVEFRRTIERLERGELQAGVGTFQAIGQGLDLPGVSVGVCATPIASNKQVFAQVLGRFCRTRAGKSAACLYYLWDRRVFGLKHLRNIVSWNSNVVVRDDAGGWREGRQYLREQES